MKKTICTLIFALTTITFFAQNEILSENDIPKLNSIIKSLEKDYHKDKSQVYKTFPQTTADYFEIVTNNPKDFLYSLNNSANFEQLIQQNTNLQIDRDLLIIKTVGFDYNKQKEIEVKSFEIGRSFGHRINLNFNDTLNNNHIRFIYSINKDTYGANKNASIIQGFYLKGPFISKNLPEKYADWIDYTDAIVKPKTSIFFNDENELNELYSFKETIIDSLVSYYESKTNKPVFKKEQDYIERMTELNNWQKKKEKYSDSLFNNDKEFKNLLLKSLSYAEENKVSNGDLEDFTAQLISKEKALNLMRQNQKVGSCSFDNSPIIQQKRIAKLSAQTQNWEVFIKAFLNVMNDYAPRIADSNIASQSRSTYIEELFKLDLDIHKILLGSNLRIEDSINNHYFSNGRKIAQSYANLGTEHQQYFENTILDIISNDSVDAFNKLHFYNTVKNYQYFIKDSIKKAALEKDIKNLVPLLPKEIKSRIENPNKQLYDLLYREKEELDNFEVKSSIIAHIGSYSYDGDCWQAQLVDKNSDGKIIYDLTMAIGEEITPLQNFIDKKNELKSRVEKHSFLQQIINDNKENKVYIKFTTDKSFVNHRNRVTEDMPKELVEKLNFENAISLYVSFPKRTHVRFVLLKNGNLLLLEIPKNFELPGYSFEDLMTEKEESFLSTTYKSFKLFNEIGEMLN